MSKLSEVCAEVVREKSARMIRTREGQVAEYDSKPLFTGNKRGWVMVDLFTANAVCTVYNAISDENKAKFDALPARKAINLTWSLIK